MAETELISNRSAQVLETPPAPQQVVAVVFVDRTGARAYVIPTALRTEASPTFAPSTTFSDKTTSTWGQLRTSPLLSPGARERIGEQFRANISPLLKFGEHRAAADIMAKFRDQFQAIEPAVLKLRAQMLAPSAPLKGESIDHKFRRLADQWHRATDHLSTTIQILADRSYKEILTMGKVAIPLILDDLQRRPGHWFEALELLTNANPARKAKNRREAAQAWLQWGRQHGLARSATEAA